MVCKHKLVINTVEITEDIIELTFSTPGYEDAGWGGHVSDFATTPKPGDKMIIETWGGLGSLTTAYSHNGRRTVVDPRAY